MKNLHNQIIYLFLIFAFLSNCSSVKDAITIKKKAGGDEFLVKKKNPLTMPEDFNELPNPENINSSAKTTNDTEDDFNIKNALNRKSNTETSSSNKINNNLEKSIIEKINN